MNETYNKIIDKIPKLVNEINSSNIILLVKSIVTLRKIVSTDDTPKLIKISEAIIKSGVVPKLVNILNFNESPRLQFESAWILSNIISGTTEQAHYIVSYGVTEIFISLLGSPDDDVKEQSAWALSNIAGDSYNLRDLVLSKGGLLPILNLLDNILSNTNNVNLPLFRNVASALTNLCRNKPHPPFEVIRPSMPILERLIHFHDTEVLIEAVWSLRHISNFLDIEVHPYNAIINSNMCDKLIELLQHPSDAIKSPIVSLFANITAGTEIQSRILLNLSIVPYFYNLLKSKKSKIRKETCGIISNITANNESQLQYIIDANLIPIIIDILKNDEFIIRKEAAFVISNAYVVGTKEQTEFITNHGGLISLCNILDDPGLDNLLLSTLISALEEIIGIGVKKYKNIIKDAGGKVKLETLVHHPIVSERVEELLYLIDQ